ncbi:MAG: hypothetical protein KDK91_06370 [Gammaproteobacteria bacterium]|nr:hypothetical protein [Gammaproteobacteria bacterium]
MLELPDALEPGQRVLLYMDGTRQGADAGTGTVILDAIERGTHTLVAEIVSADGRTIARTDPRRFHLLRASAINQPGGPDLPGGAGSTSR